MSKQADNVKKVFFIYDNRSGILYDLLTDWGEI